MIQEVIAYMTTPASAWARDLGFLAESISIDARWNRYSEAYRPHQRNCHEAILNATEDLPNRQRIVLLGAGIIYDVPLADLIERFAEVVLVDCIFSKTTRKLVREFPSVKLVEFDLSGVCQALAEHDDKESLPALKSGFPDVALEADLVVSLNILSQLPLMPEKFARKRKWDGNIAKWGEQIECAHIIGLQELPGPSLLITDFAHLTYLERSHNSYVEESTLYSITSDPETEWIWDYRPESAESGKGRCALKVGVWMFRK